MLGFSHRKKRLWGSCRAPNKIPYEPESDPALHSGYRDVCMFNWKENANLLNAPKE